MARRFVVVSAVFGAVGCVLALSLKTSNLNTITATLAGLMIGANFELWARKSHAILHLLEWVSFLSIWLVAGVAIGNIAFRLSPLWTLAVALGMCLFGLAVEVARDVFWLAKAADMRHYVYAEEGEYTLEPSDPSNGR